MNSNNIEIKFEAKNNQSVAYDGNNAIGRCKFARLNGQWVITLTEKEYGGQGIGKQLVLKVIDEARCENVKIVPSCPYARKVMLENPEEFSDVLQN